MTEAQQETYEAILRETDHYKASLVAVSKTHPNEAIESLYAKGQRDFGENRVQELADKYEQLPKDIRWHFIGHLQRNKVKYIAPFVHLIHGVDSPRLLRAIAKEGRKNNRAIDVLLQFHIAQEESKFGFDWAEAKDLLDHLQKEPLEGVRIVGVMGMATYTDHDEQIAEEFATLSAVFERIKTNYFADAEYFREVSMGMSGDYPLALQHGSTMVRIGSLLFGARKK